MMANPYGIFPTMPTNSSATLLCAQCKKFFTYMDSVVMCDGACKRWYHTKCAKIPETKYRVIQDKDDNRTLGLKCVWSCKDCRERPEVGRDPEFESYVREKLGKLGQVLEYLVTKIQDIENRQKSQEVEFNKHWQQQQQTAVTLQGATLPSPRTTHIFQDYGNQGHHSGQQLTANAQQQTSKEHIPGFTPMEHKIIHEVKLKMDSAAPKQQEIEAHAGDALHLMRPLIDPITGQEMEATQTQEAGDALYNFTGNFSGASASAQGQATPTPALKEAMECHYGDCKCIKQEGQNDESNNPPKPCSGKHCNCTCKTHKIVIAHKKDNVGKIHKCPHCDFTSKRSDNVRRHMLRHTGERPHKCPHCDFSAKRPHSLKKHIENVHNKDLRTDGIVR
ncbi:zinc finger protein 768-like isoform X2 [Homarus americanus]|uniref:zinc finger protein 768-like isoform X2 n=1 Tax=Homarus americanus TaxID=6706 RepID=UPI001C460FC3|nr:zinc finger protein 768-like isoform X2 [Homarus americanus]